MEKKVFLGFDGYIDKILRPIRKKNDKDGVEAFKSMHEFSEYLDTKSGTSCSIDLELIEKKIGGNMPNTAYILGKMGIACVCVGAMGKPKIITDFQEMPDNCELVSVEEPGSCRALEFSDGKLMLSTNTSIDTLDFKKITETVSVETLARYIDECDAAAFLNWGEMIKSNDIWENIMKQVLPLCHFDKKKLLLIDFSDFSRRKSEDVFKMQELLSELNAFFEVVISVNENELKLFAEEFKTEGKDTDQLIAAVKERLVCKYFVVHLLKETKVFVTDKVKTLKKEVIENPKVITGGGDSFNAGLLSGLLLNCDIETAVQLGNYVVSLYVQNSVLTRAEEMLSLLKTQEDGNE